MSSQINTQFPLQEQTYDYAWSALYVYRRKLKQSLIIDGLYGDLETHDSQRLLPVFVQMSEFICIIDFLLKHNCGFASSAFWRHRRK